MIINTEIARFFTEVLEQGEYKYLFRDYIVIDVGCNVGMFSLWLQDHATQIHAIDISKECIETLNKTIKDNHLDNIRTYNVGITYYTGEGLIEKIAEPSYGSWRLNENGTEKIPVYTLTDFMNSYNIPYADILKLDVEGGEKRIIDDNFPKDRISTIIGEFHYGQDQDIREFCEKFMKMGYHFLWASQNHFIARR